jgi:uncharacterized membrane protein
MAKRLRIVLANLTTTLWFVPLIMSTVAAAFAILVLETDFELNDPWWLHQGNATDASGLLSSLLNSLMTISALVISITVVVLTLAARQLGPRILLSFMADKRTQFALGYFIATVVYFLLVLRVINSDLSQDEVPHLAVTIASVLMLGALLTLLFYTHHLARAIVADTVISRIGSDLNDAVRRHFPNDKTAQKQIPTDVENEVGVIRYKESGYIQSCDYEALSEAAARSGSIVQLAFRPGDYVIAGECGAIIWPYGDTPREDFLAESIVIDDVQSADQDVLFAARQLVEIALRALSSGNSDPFTAIATINRLAAATAIAIERSHPVGVWSKKQCHKAGWLLAPVVTFSDLVNTSFDEIRDAAPPFPSVLVHLFAQFLTLLRLSRTDEQRTAIRRQLEQLLEIDSDIVKRYRGSWSQQIEAAGDGASETLHSLRHA